jgi:hypothetical protein
MDSSLNNRDLHKDMVVDQLISVEPKDMEVLACQWVMAVLHLKFQLKDTAVRQHQP